MNLTILLRTALVAVAACALTCQLPGHAAAQDDRYDNDYGDSGFVDRGEDEEWYDPSDWFDDDDYDRGYTSYYDEPDFDDYGEEFEEDEFGDNDDFEEENRYYRDRNLYGDNDRYSDDFNFYSDDWFEDGGTFDNWFD